MIVSDFIRLNELQSGERVLLPDGKEGVISHHFESAAGEYKIAVFLDDLEHPKGFKSGTLVKRIETCYEHLIRKVKGRCCYTETDEWFSTLSLYQTEYTTDKLKALQRWSHIGNEVANISNGFSSDNCLGDIHCSHEHDCCGCICERRLEFFIVPGSVNVWFSITEARNY